jgi:hypothetical protein
MKYFIFIFAFAISLFDFCAVALSQEIYAIHVQEPLQILIGILFLIFAAIIGAGLTYFLNRNKTKLEALGIDEKTRTYLDKAIQSGLGYAENLLKKKAENIADPKIQNQLIAEALNYVLDRVPDAVNHFKLEPKDLEKMILARFTPEIAGASDVASNPQ